MKKVIMLPAWLLIEVADLRDGAHISHTLQAGTDGFGRVLDPLLRLYFSADFFDDLDEHAQTEFPMLAALIGEGDLVPGSYH